MTDSGGRVADVVEHFKRVEREHMQGLPIVNPRLCVEAIGVRPFEEHDIFVLISSWFMNLVLLPGNDSWESSKQGESCTMEFPYSPIEFTVCHDDEFGTYLSAALFRTVSDFPDQASARAVAEQVAEDLFTTVSAADRAAQANPRRKLSRRSLLTGHGAS